MVAIVPTVHEVVERILQSKQSPMEKIRSLTSLIFQQGQDQLNTKRVAIITLAIEQVATEALMKQDDWK